MPPQPSCLCGECAKCKQREKVRVWREANPERTRELSRNWRAANPERIKEIERLRYERDGEKRRAKNAEWRAANPGYEWARDKEMQQTDPERWREQNRKRQQRHRARNPEKERARRILSDAIRYGKVKREPCEDCGDADSQAHHDDYSKPLEVRWLCRTHHWEAHSKTA